MADGIKTEGIDELIISLENADITENQERAILKKAIEPAIKALERDTPKGQSGKLEKIKAIIKKDGFATTATLKAGAFWGMFQEFGTSRSKKNIGYFHRSIKNTENEVIDRISKDLLKNFK